MPRLKDKLSLKKRMAGLIHEQILCDNYPSFIHWCKKIAAGFFGVFLLFNFLQGAQAQPDADGIGNLAPAGWIRNSELLGLKIDQYQTRSGSINIELIAFPPTDQKAAQWLDRILPVILKGSREAGRSISIVNDDGSAENNVPGSMHSSREGVDIATRTFHMPRSGSGEEPLSRVVRAVVRSGEPVQFSLLSMGEASASENELQQANVIRFEAQLPYNESAAFLGVDAMASLMIEPLLSSNGKSDYLKPNPKASSAGTATSSEATVSEVESEPADSSTFQKSYISTPGSGNLAPEFVSLPGPQVELTGTWLKNLPDGYRLHVRSRNYWTSSDMTSTRTRFLTLTADGQFEVGSFSVMGGLGGVGDTLSTGVFNHNKNGSSGRVFGDTNPAGPGSNTIMGSKREGLDPSKYGAYHISGEQLEMRYADGKVEKKSFKTNGHTEMVIDDKRYFMGSPDGWEKRDTGKSITMYRSLDGAYMAKVSKIDKEIENGFQWLGNFLERMKAKGLYLSSGPIKGWKGGFSHYNVVKSAVVVNNDSGKEIIQDIYVKFGSENRLIQIDRYSGAEGDNTVLEFIKYVD